MVLLSPGGQKNLVATAGATAEFGVNFTTQGIQNTKNFCFLYGTWITTGMSQCLDVLPLATGRARAGL